MNIGTAKPTFDEMQGYRFDNGVDQQEWLNLHVTGSACYGHTNMVPEFCRVYTEITGNKVLAVHVAKGSTVIDDWLPGGAGYEIIVKKLVQQSKWQNHMKMSIGCFLYGCKEKAMQ